MLRVFGDSRGNRRPTTAAPGGPRPTRQRGGGGNKAAGSPEPTAASSTVATVSPSGATSGRGARAARESRRRTKRIKREVTHEERVKVAAALAAVGAERGRRKSERATAPKPSSYLGRKTAGAPTKSELDAAHASGTLKVNKAGAVTTPAVRQTSKQLRQAAAAVAAAQPHITGLRNKAQEEFAAELSRKTGIPPKLAGEWTLQESGAASAGAGGEAGEQNQLGVGYPAHPTSFSESPYFNNTTPKKAADATAKWMEGKLGADYDYQAASSIQQIPRLAKSGASEEEIRAYIEGPSAWGTGTIAQSGVSAVPGRGAQKAARRLKSAKKEAKSLGLKPGRQTSAAVGPPPKKLVKRTVIAEHAMREIEGQPYIWGGGHGSFTEYGKDCSGAVGYVLHKVMPKRMTSPLTSGDMGSVLEPGPGALTVFYNDEHTFLRLINRKGEAEYWGTSVGDSGAGGLTRHDTPSSSYLAEYNVGHVPGMGKLQALQLGADPATVTGGGSAAGVTLGSSGTTATIDRGAGVVKKGKPGRSKRPIILTTLQKYNRNKAKLASVGAPIGSPSRKSGRTESHPILEELKEKYGSPSGSTMERAAAAAAG